MSIYFFSFISEDFKINSLKARKQCSINKSVLEIFDDDKYYFIFKIPPSF